MTLLPGRAELMPSGSSSLLPEAPDLAESGTGKLVRGHLSAVVQLIQDIHQPDVAALIAGLEKARSERRTVFLMGNGGSAATALHMANDLARATRPGIPPFHVTCLSGNVSHLSGLANDYGYDQVFVRQLTDLVEPGDVVFGISASGNSMNCVNALTYGRQQGAVTLSFLGFDGGRMKALSDLSVHVPCPDYLLVEDVHLMLAHCLARALKSGA